MLRQLFPCTDSLANTFYVSKERYSNNLWAIDLSMVDDNPIQK